MNKKTFDKVVNEVGKQIRCCEGVDVEGTHEGGYAIIISEGELSAKISNMKKQIIGITIAVVLLAVKALFF